MAPRSILITGCSSGIGRHAALQLHRRGWRVFATARKAGDLERLREVGVTAVYLDYADPASIASCAEHVIAETGGTLFALFNNGAYGQPGAVEDIAPDVLRAQFEANFFGWHDLTRRLLPAMRRQGEGRIVQCSSVLGLSALRYRGAYVASKFAVEGLTDTLRLELRGTGIHVSLIEPGPIATRFAETALAKFRAHVDIQASAHAEHYKHQLARLEKGGTSSPFKLGPEAVFAKLLHALERSRPKPRYYVTAPTHVFAALKRLLPIRAMDWVLDRASR